MRARTIAPASGGARQGRYRVPQAASPTNCTGQIENLCESASEVSRAAVSGYRDLPLIVVSSANADERRLQADAALARRSARGRHVRALDSAHWIPPDAPKTVIDAIVAMVREIRMNRI